ncbi:SapC family protein [Sphingomonas solaris]|uniref:SapC family protein n=1 Tax=Alterirhizorhabdus solaris TaxID=2529389 RepID=A0A558R7J0_9SPHN|nr:SapC family protein [Sphingomonas solaris]TVV75288.1 SapC family protein [Sphingomonas solaris]
MASAPEQGLPLFYNRLEPLSSVAHGDWKARKVEAAPFLATAHAVPLTVEEFALAQRHYPIVFSAGDNPVPLALMGLNEGVNVFVDETGKLTSDVYVPAYVRRYPFMLARLRPEADELSLCFDPGTEVIGKFEEGEPLFEDGQPAAATRDVLAFCEQFEQAGQRTAAFMKELADHKLLIDGEVSIQPEGADQPFVYRGFQMISEDKLRELRGDVARKLIQSGLLALVYGHLFSLSLIREIFGRQVQLGKVPGAQAFAPAGEPVAAS